MLMKIEDAAAQMRPSTVSLHLIVLYPFVVAAAPVADATGCVGGSWARDNHHDHQHIFLRRP